MIKSLEFIKETIELNRDILMESEEDTNEMLVVDLLEAMGYDRRRSRNLIKIRGQEADWKLITNNGYLIMRVVALGGDLLGERAENMKPADIIGADECVGEKFIGLISTDGSRLVVNTQRFPNEPIIDIDIISNTEGSLEVLKRISSKEDVKEYINSVEDSKDTGIIKELIENKNPELLNDNLVDTFGAEKIFSIIDSYYADRVTENTVAAGPITVEVPVEAPIPEGMELINSDELARIKTHALEADQLKAEIDELKKDRETREDSEINSLKNLVASLNSKVAEKEAILSSYEKRDILNKQELEQYKKDVTELRKLVDNSSVADANSYIAQIEELSLKVSQLESVIEEKDREIEGLKSGEMLSEDTMLSQCKAIIDTIEDDPTEPKSYVGVVNGNLFQTKTIEKFVGNALQELYSIVTFELMPYLFDGDIFTITDKAIRNDMLISNRMYDILLDDMSDSDCINRLKTLFSKFPAVVFLTKTIGNENVVVEEDVEASAFDSDFTFNDEPVSEEVEGVVSFDGDEPIGEIGEAVTESTDELIDDFGVDFGEEVESVEVTETVDATEFIETEVQETVDAEVDELDDNFDTGYNVTGTVCFAVCDLGNVLWNDMIKIKEPKYIYYPEKTFVIGGFTLDEQFSSLVHALMCYTDNSFLSAKRLSETDLSNVSNLINTDGIGIAIPFTKYFIDTAEFNKTLPVLTYICDTIGVSTENTYIYFSGSVLSEEYSSNVVDTSDFNFKSVDMAEFKEDIHTDQHCIIPGNVLVNFKIDDTFYGVLRNLVTRCVAVKTNYMQVPFKSHDDLEYAITEILVNYEGDLEELSDSLGNCPGEDFRIISRNAEDVSKNHFRIQLNGNDYYVSDVQPWQQVCVLLMMHRTAVGDNTISLRVILDKELFNRYVNELTESDPEKAFAIKSLIDYMSDRLKS